MRSRSRRLGWIVGAVAAAGLTCALVLNAFRANVMFFVSPSQIAAQQVPAAHRFRLGGLVERGSLTRAADGLSVRFVVTDTVKQVAVVYHGVLPDLFREGSGVVAQGRLGSDGQFHADEVLAKHDEKYMPPDAAEAVRRAQTSVMRPAAPAGIAAPAALHVTARSPDGERRGDGRQPGGAQP
ncbi:cytochrome c maturation protein CcmE [Paraburkholderia sp.]|uniref:cytochrome c maturation protein CcmE n=1 Tax=Paraburkholderia sp. TaxID=1926495 RepID=UPI0039C97ED6